MPLKEALHTAACLASVNATVPRGHETLSPALCWDLRARACFLRRLTPTASVGCSAPAPGAHWTTPARWARSLTRTVGGHREISRSPRIPATRLCKRHARDDGTSIRVWCSHLGWHPHTASKSGHDTVCW